MKKILVKRTQSETIDLAVPGEESLITLSLDQGDYSKMVRNNILSELKAAGLVLRDIMSDFVHFGLAIYTADQTVSRGLNGFQGWSRHIKIYFPVSNLERWNDAKELLERYVGFLSGDKWEFEFRQIDEIENLEEPPERNPEGYSKVCLLSGGVDSFVAAVDLLSSDTEKPVFVSHYKTGTESKTQDKVVDGLGEKYGVNRFKSHKFYVQPNQKNENAKKENSSRARSLLFISLGLSVANSLGDEIELVLPENGLISLNVPLTRTRLSSHSTRTTHPFFVEGLNHILRIIGIQNHIINPYQFMTKGEMMLQCKDLAFLREKVGETISCSHPEQSRYLGKPPGLNCGYCVPCIIRQAAEHKSGGVITEYGIGDVRLTPPPNKTVRGSDLRAFKISLLRIEKMSHNHSFALEVLRSGPIPENEEYSIGDFVSVFRNGMAEVKSFLES